MTLDAEAGAMIFPVIPAFDSRPIDSIGMARQYFCSVLAEPGLPQPETYV
jgi:4-hydroxy-3-polyprenylbenzoate decarboxylase